MTKFKLRELLQMLMLLPMLASVKGMHLNPQLAQGSSAHTPTFWSKWHDPSLRTFIKQPQVYTQKFVQPATPSTVSSRSSLASSPPTTPPSSLRQVQVKAVPAQRYSYNQAQPAYTAHPSQFYVNQHAPTQQLTAAPAPVRTAVSGPPSPRSQPMIQVRSQGLTSPRSLVCRSQAQTGPAALQPRGVVALAPVPLPKAVRFHEQNIQTREVAKPRTIQPAAPTQAHNFADDRDNNKRNQFQHLDENDSPIGSTKYIPNKTEKRTLAFETSASRDCQCAQKGKTEIQADIKLQMVDGYWTGPDGEQGWKLFDAAKSGKYDWMGVDKDGWWVRIGVLEGVADPQKERPESLGWRYVKEPTQMEIQLVYAGEVADECISGCCFARLSGSPQHHDKMHMDSLAYFNGPKEGNFAGRTKFLEHRFRPRKSELVQTRDDKSVYNSLNTEFNEFFRESVANAALAAEAQKRRAREQSRQQGIQNALHDQDD